jgi:hypothetical protein
MPGKGHLEGRGENPHPRVGELRGQDERRLGQIELQREGLHVRVGKSSRILEYRERIAFEPIFGKHVDDPKSELAAAVVQGLSTSCGARASIMASTCAANVAMAAADVSVTSITSPPEALPAAK